MQTVKQSIALRFSYNSEILQPKRLHCQLRSNACSRAHKEVFAVQADFVDQSGEYENLLNVRMFLQNGIFSINQLHLTAYHLVKAHCMQSTTQSYQRQIFFPSMWSDSVKTCTDRACWECDGVNQCVVTSHALHAGQIPPTVRSGQRSQGPDPKFVLSNFGKRSNSQYCYQYV